MKTKVAVRIETNKKDEIVVKRVNYSRFQFFGFGSFIWKTKPEEVSVSKKAFDLLKQCVGKKVDLPGMWMVFNDTSANKKHRGFIFNYGFLGPELNVPLKDVELDLKFYEEILSKAEKTDEAIPIDEEDQKRWIKIEKLDAENKEASVNRILNKYYKTKDKD